MPAPTLPLPDPVHADPDRLVAAHEQAAEFYRHQLLHADGPRHYLTARGMAVRAAAPVLTHVPSDEAARLVQYVADVTGTSIDTVTAAVLDAFDAERAARETESRIRSPAAARDTTAQGQLPVRGDSPGAMVGRARYAFPSWPHPPTRPSAPATRRDHPIYGRPGRNTDRRR